MAFVLLASSALTYGVIFALPWAPWSASTKWGLAGGFYALSYVFFFGAVALMGRPAWDALVTRGKTWARQLLDRQ